MEGVPAEQVQAVKTDETAPLPTADSNKTEPVAQGTSSLLQSLLQEQPEDEIIVNGKKKKKKKKAKTGRQKEIDRLTKETKGILETPEQLNVVCERIHSLLSGRKKVLLSACQLLDKFNLGSLSYEQFRLVIRDRLPQMSPEDLFVLTKLFQTDGTAVDYRAIFDEELDNGILQHVTKLVVPLPTDVILEKKPPKEAKRPFNEPFQLDRPRYVTVHLRLITFDTYNAYPGHVRLTVPDHISVYALSKMVIEETDLAIRSIEIFREKPLTREVLLQPMRSLQSYEITGAYIDGTHKQSFPAYTLYYDHLPLGIRGDCPILKCDYYMKRK